MTLYDEVAYPNAPRIQTHPLRLGAAARLHGAPAPAFDQARILEIGCGDGGNIVNLALTAPGATVVGFDLAEAPVRAGQAAVAALGLDNCTLHALDLLDAPGRLGTFDYIIAHGVYAWTPAPVRDALMRLMGEALSPDGVGLVSYNALPGCHLRRIVRDLLVRHMAEVEGLGPRTRAATALLETFIGAWDQADPLQAALKAEAERMLARPVEVFFHDELSAAWEPQYLADVAAHGRAHGLAYMCDTQPAEPPLAALASLRVSDPLAQAQLTDFALQRRFHHSLFRRAGGAFDPALDWRRLEGLFATTDLRSAPSDHAGEWRFTTAAGDDIGASDPDLAGRLVAMAAAYPNLIPLEGLAAAAGEALLQLFVSGLLQVQTGPFPMITSPGPRPLASPLARWQLADGRSEVTSLNHRTVRLVDPTMRRFVQQLDGHRDGAAIARAMQEDGADPIDEQQIHGALRQVAAFGLLKG